MIKYNLPPEQYFDHVGISVSGLNKMGKSPAHYQSSLTNPMKQSPALQLGSAVHCSVLEPEEFSKRYALADYDRRFKEGKARHQEMLDLGIEGLAAEMYAQVVGMQKSVLSHPLAKSLLESGDKEVSCFQDRDGVMTKARADCIKHNIIVDLKTTQDASPKEFMKSVLTFKYYRQAAWYLQLFGNELDVEEFYFICVEKEPPYAVAVYCLDESALARGQSEVEDLFNQYRFCLENDSWPSYPEEIKTLSLGDWR